MFDELVKWSAEKPSRKVSIEILEGKIDQVWIYESGEGKFLILGGEEKRKLEDVDFEAIRREKLRAAYEEGKKLFEAS